jgi:hypothetical protein
VFTAEEHLDNLVRHIDLVRQAGVLLGRRIMARGQRGDEEFGRILIGKVYVHDASKFAGIEWKYLHAGKDVPKEQLDLAIQQHVETNDHHPEFHGGFHQMPDVCIAEMVCDWYARAMEFGTGLRDWIENQAVQRFNIDTDSPEYKRLQEFVDILLEDSFVRQPASRPARRRDASRR